MPRIQQQDGAAGQAIRQTKKLVEDAKKVTTKAASAVKKSVKTGEELLNKTKELSGAVQKAENALKGTSTTTASE